MAQVTKLLIFRYVISIRASIVIATRRVNVDLSVKVEVGLTTKSNNIYGAEVKVVVIPNIGKRYVECSA